MRASALQLWLAGRQPQRPRRARSPWARAGSQHWVATLVFLIALSVSVRAQTADAPNAPAPPADAWITNAVQYPAPFQNTQVAASSYRDLHAEVLVGQLKILCPVAATPAGGGLRLHASIDAPGHWRVRDWRTYPMVRHGPQWEVALPVFDLDLPVVYFVSVPVARGAVLSSMRICHPRGLGMRVPTRLFWSFLEGFEEDLDSWRGLSPEAPPLHTDPEAHTGHAALAVEIPYDKHSVTVATTRLRGWHLWKLNCRGLQMWLRAKEGTGRVRLSLLANAFTTNQVISVLPREIPLSNQWVNVSVRFSEFPPLPRSTVDLLAIEFIAQGPREFLMDDLRLLAGEEEGL